MFRSPPGPAKPLPDAITIPPPFATPPLIVAPPATKPRSPPLAAAPLTPPLCSCTLPGSFAGSVVTSIVPPAPEVARPVASMTEPLVPDAVVPDDILMVPLLESVLITSGVTISALPDVPNAD